MKNDVLFLKHSENNPRNSEGAFLELSGNRIIFVYSRYSGDSWHDHAACDLACRESSDSGRSWTASDSVIFSHADVQVQNIMSVSLLRLTNKRILLFACCKFTDADGTVNCIPSVAYSDDEAVSWSKLTAITPNSGYYVLCNDRTVQLANGRIIVPLASDKNILHYYASDDLGKTWQMITPPITPEADNDGCTIYQEPGVIELADHTLWSFVRTESGRQYGLWSKDSGNSWSKPVPMNDFVSPMAPMSVKRNPLNGKLTAIWNDHLDRWDAPPPEYTRPGWGDVPTGGRFPLVLAESSDEGKSWHNARRLEKDPRCGYCYTAMYFTNKALLLAYCCGGINNTIMLQDLKIVRIDMQGDGTLDFAGI